MRHHTTPHTISRRSLARWTAAGLTAVAGFTSIGETAHADEPLQLEPIKVLYTVQADDHSAELDQTWCSGNVGCAIVTSSCAANGGTATVWTNRQGETHGVCTY